MADTESNVAKKSAFISPVPKGQLGAKPAGNPPNTSLNAGGHVFVYKVDKKIEADSKMTSPQAVTEKLIESKGK